MNLKLIVKSFCDNGDLHFESGVKSTDIHYQFGQGYPKGSLKKGSEINITFKKGEKEIPIIGIFPEVLETVSPLAQCIWVLASDLIYSNVFYILAGQSEKPDASDIIFASQEMSGEVPNKAIEVLFV